MRKLIPAGMVLALMLLVLPSCVSPQEYAKVSSDLAVAQKEIEALQSELAAKEDELSVKEATIQGLQQEMQDKQNQIEDLEEALGEVSVPPTPTPTPTAAIEVTAAQLCADWDANELAAEEKYKNKLLEVTGEITDIATASGGPYIAFSTGDLFCDVHAYLSVTQIDVAMTLAKGDMVTVVGTCKGMGIMTIDLKECYIA